MAQERKGDDIDTHNYGADAPFVTDLITWKGVYDKLMRHIMGHSDSHDAEILRFFLLFNYDWFETDTDSLMEYNTENPFWERYGYRRKSWIGYSVTNGKTYYYQYNADGNWSRITRDHLFCMLQDILNTVYMIMISKLQESATERPEVYVDTLSHYSSHIVEVKTTYMSKVVSHLRTWFHRVN